MTNHPRIQYLKTYAYLSHYFMGWMIALGCVSSSDIWPAGRSDGRWMMKDDLPHMSSSWHAVYWLTGLQVSHCPTGELGMDSGFQERAVPNIQTFYKAYVLSHWTVLHGQVQFQGM